MALLNSQRRAPHDRRWPEWTALGVIAIVILCVLRPSRPGSGDAVPTAAAPSRSIPVKLTVGSTTFGAGDAVQIRVTGLPNSSNMLANASIDGGQTPSMSTVRPPAAGSKAVDVDVPARFILPGPHLLALELTSTRGTTKYDGTTRIRVMISEGQAVAHMRVGAKSRDILYSVDEISDGRNIHIVAAGQADPNAVLRFGERRALVVEGWAATAAHTLPAAVVFRIDGGALHAAALGDERPDVAQAFATSALQTAGFTARFSTRGLQKGAHRLEFFVVPTAGSPAEPAGAPIRFVVTAS